MGMPDIGRALGERWSALTDEAKVVFQEKATADRTRYESEMAAAGLPLVKERPSRASGGGAPKERPARKRKKPDYDDEELIDWYVPELSR